MRFARNFPPGIASDHNAARSPASHLSMRDLTSVKISRQRRRWPVAGLARTHFASMRSFDQLEKSAGASHTAERHSLNTPAQRSLAPLGMCCRVGQEAWKMVVREGRSGQMVGGKDGSDGRNHACAIIIVHV